VTAADAERRRIERNLHDGAQQRLIALLLRLDDPELEPVRDELALALEELRELAHGLFPPILTSEGLEPALEAAARRAGLPVRVDAGDIGRLEPELEAAVYFCCVEALQNAAKRPGVRASRTPSSSRSRTTASASPPATVTGSPTCAIASRRWVERPR
jgi:signal transduction histidine kinase